MTAIAAAAIVGSVARPPAADADVFAVADATTTTAVVTTTTEEPDDNAARAIACTTGVAELIEAELDGSIDPLQAAALDALRQICDDDGYTVAGPPASEPIIEVVTVRQPASSAGDDDDSAYSDDDDEYDDDHDDDEHEDEEDEEDEHEDEDDA